jgi:hypothetical protein
MFTDFSMGQIWAQKGHEEKKEDDRESRMPSRLSSIAA